MKREEKILEQLRRFAFLLPLLLLPLAPALGKVGADLVLAITVAQGNAPSQPIH